MYASVYKEGTNKVFVLETLYQMKEKYIIEIAGCGLSTTARQE
jgi:hypothetical protein